MGDDKSAAMTASRDRELLIPVAESVHDDSSKASSSSSSASSHHAGREVFFFHFLFSRFFVVNWSHRCDSIRFDLTFYKIVQSWASKKFMTGW
ncbi:hypothetical protein Gorai_020240 [Gossypium raimondii]|uniref:Uncharacterized protein n=1 Tax=Gossypium raimondii TaxID=29730 RepID=A0A7J8NMA5_GOSRA|nr:hypothetical protein [Gossypium raimondii]